MLSIDHLYIISITPPNRVIRLLKLGPNILLGPRTLSTAELNTFFSSNGYIIVTEGLEVLKDYEEVGAGKVYSQQTHTVTLLFKATPLAKDVFLQV